ncbi:hypothetical protein [Pseudomonas protegens]
MNDLVKPSKPQTSVDLPKGSAEPIVPRILSITNGDGTPIPPDGTTTNGHLTIVGEATPNQQVEVLTDGFPEVDPYDVDADGHFTAHQLNQKRGRHRYIARASDGQESAAWTVDVDVSATTMINWVVDPNGYLVESGQHTFYDELTLHGRGTPNKITEIVNNGTVVKVVENDQYGVWNTTLKDLGTGTQHFISREPNGQQSAIWRVLIKQSAPISIQFVFGNESFQLIGNQETTTDKSVVLVGTANPGETGWIVDYERDLERFTANENGLYFVKINGLKDNHVHTFRVKSDKGRLSAPWAIRVVSSKLR